MDSSEYVEWAAYTALFLVLALVIVVIIFYMYYRTTPTPTPDSSVNVWTINSSRSTNNQVSIVGNNYTAYFVSTQSSTFRVEVSPPLQAVGKTFAILNPGSTTVTVTGQVTDTIPPGNNVQYMWIRSDAALKF